VIDSGKPRLLLIPNVSSWILGEMSRWIAHTHGHHFEIISASEVFAQNRRDLFTELVRGADIVHAMNESAVPLILGCGLDKLPPIITWIHHFTSWNDEHQMAVEHSRAITACTDEWAERIRRRSGRPDLPVYTIVHGVDHVEFSPQAPNRAKYSIPEDAFVVGFSASKGSDKDANRKGLDTLAKVMHLLKSKIPALYVLFTTDTWNEEIERLGRNGIRAGATGFLPRNDLPGFYAAIDALLVTATVEGGPVTVLESMACGTPVVSTKVGLVPQTINNGVNGFCAEVGDAAALAAALERLQQDPDLARSISQRARQDILDRPWPKTLAPLRGIYQSLSSGKPPEAPWFSSPLKIARFSNAAWAAEVIMSAYRKFRISGSMLKALSTLKRSSSGLHAGDFWRGLSLLPYSRIPVKFNKRHD
jgi:glycosyltransferase involved in cell wall biosynthesis